MARQDGSEMGNGGGGAAPRSPGNERFAATSFLWGGNAAYVEQLHERYRSDPQSVDPAWRDFFAELNDDPNAVSHNAHGPAWKKPSWPVTANGELVSALDGDWPATEKAIAAKLKPELAAPPAGVKTDPSRDARLGARLDDDPCLPHSRSSARPT